MQFEIINRCLTPALILILIPSVREYVGIQKILCFSLSLYFVLPALPIYQCLVITASTAIPFILISETFQTIGRSIDLARGALFTEQIIPGSQIHGSIFEGVGKQLGLLALFSYTFIPPIEVSKGVLEQLQSVFKATAPLMLITVTIEIIFFTLAKSNPKFQLNTELSGLKLTIGMFYAFFLILNG